jgi:serine/threonine protein kinase
MPLASGSRLGPYEIIELAGAGGMGEVYKARDTRLDRIVALKLPSEGIGDDLQLRARFQREARIIAALNSPHICAIHDVANFEGRDVIVMEYFEGETLERRLSRGALSLPEFFRHAIALAEALVAAHHEGMIHRDLKPSNVMLTRSGLKLLDFGIAKQRTAVHGGSPEDAMQATTTAAVTVEGALIGTAPYMAPEQLEGRTADTRTDIFALGSLLFEMATGRRAFHGTSTAALMAAIMAESRPHVREVDSSLPVMLDRMISTCLALQPDDRYQNVKDLLRELRWCENDLGEMTSLDAPTRRSTGWRVHASWAAALILSVGVVAGALWRSSETARDALPPPNPVPVIVLMDSPLPGRVYDPRTAAEGGTNADDVTDVLRDLPVTIRKENTSAAWHREEQVVGENPDLIIGHLSCLMDARIGGNQQPVLDHLFEVAENRLVVFLAYVAARNPRTKFIIYSRSAFAAAEAGHTWVAMQEGRLPVLKGRLNAFHVPASDPVATFRDPATATLLRARVTAVIGLTHR